MHERSTWDRLISPSRCWGARPRSRGATVVCHRYLKANALLIDANDLWIAATALAFDLPLVTRNERHFARAPELNMIGYA